MSSDSTKLRSGYWAVMIDSLREAAITSLSSEESRLRGNVLALDREEARKSPPQDLRRSSSIHSYECSHHSDLVPGRIESDDEYDSELDDFIDDGPEETEDYSKHIREIFGYDKSKYNDFDEDDECMESNFGQVLKEEFNSAKIGKFPSYLNSSILNSCQVRY
uniref:Uncharacterized protein n=1 Tax=Timema poppense TaxID=170557 RepID=A0A7R9HCQ4_TIMPO|nr:unnamed protein product [Timema poppensis]